jgi:hypothetical protein
MENSSFRVPVAGATFSSINKKDIFKAIKNINKSNAKKLNINPVIQVKVVSLSLV